MACGGYQRGLPGVGGYAPSSATGGDSDEFYTPRWVRELLEPLKLDMDPCSPPHRPIPATDHCVLTEGRNGLEQDWRGRVFCNPPYNGGALEVWTAKCLMEVEAKRAEVVIGLIPLRPGCNYWHASIWDKAWAIGLVAGRVAFEGLDGKPMRGPKGQVIKASFESAMVVWAGSEAVARATVARLRHERIRWIGARERWGNVGSGT